MQQLNFYLHITLVKLFFRALLFFSPISMLGQAKVWVFLTDKKNVSFEPLAYFDQKAIERRKLEGLSLNDTTDFPVDEIYVQEVRSICDSVCGTSRWFNAIACMATQSQIENMEQLCCVKEVRHMQSAPLILNEKNVTASTDNENDKAILFAQTERMQSSLLRAKGLTGKGVRIAVFDAGYKGFLEDTAFQYIITNGKIKATYDFVNDKKFVFGTHLHGTYVMSCIGGMDANNFFGCATDSEFLLARTEQAIWERTVEEENWVLSLEWADKWGADIVNSSLGYTNQFYFSKDMNGKKSIISQAASMAAHKGILVVSSAGNEGTNSWEVIGAPADADSILTIGGVDPWTGFHSGFSSYGPTSDLRMKPNLSAFGYAITTANNNLNLSSGTSFASPLVAGFAACIKQLHPEWTVRKLYDQLQMSGHLYPYFDYAHGYGIPQADYFLPDDLQIEKLADSLITIVITYNKNLNRFEVILNDSNADSNYSEKMQEWKQERNYHQPIDYLYLHIEDAKGTLLKYEVIEPMEDVAAMIENFYADDCVLRVHWKGATTERNIGILKLNCK